MHHYGIPKHCHGVFSTRPDPYQLERLAEELAAREMSSTSVGLSSGSEHLPPQPDLPICLPLSHDNEFLAAETFNVEKFLLSRSYTSLPELRTELREYLSSLKEELVLLINDDYEDFISLSTDLRGEGTRMGRLKAPLNGLREQIRVSRQSLRNIQDAIQAKLDMRSRLRDEKALLHHLLKISESITRLESLLLISKPDHAELPPSHLSGATEVSSGKTRGSRGKHLSRVATEYTQLLYIVSKARAENCAYVEEIQWSIDRIRYTLTSDLDHLFSSILAALTGIGGGKTSELEKAKLVADLTECLCVYDTLCLWRTAEDIIKRTVVLPYIRKSIHPDALAAPHSPIVPHTPLPSRAPPSSLPPRTPYTPYTAFSSKQNPFDSKDATPSIPYLDEFNDPLAKLFNQILRFVDQDLRRIMQIAEQVSVKSNPARMDPTSAAALPSSIEAATHISDRFDIMANVIWSEIGQAIMDELGLVVFAAGKPDEFLKVVYPLIDYSDFTYTCGSSATRQHRHLSSALEFIAPSTKSVQAMRSHPVFASFNKRWQLPIYFQLRWKDIVGKVEDSLSNTVISPNFTNFGHPVFLMLQAESVWAAISSCWSAEIFIPDLAHRFWRLTLQLLSRYKIWLETALPQIEASVQVTSPTDKVVRSSLRSSTPQTSSETLPENNAVDDLLKQYAIILVDIKAMTLQVLVLWREEISSALPELAASQDMHIDPEDALREQLTLLNSIADQVMKQVVQLLSRRACDSLLPVRSIPSQFRAMSSKRVPTEPSYFVPLILRPVKAFFGIGGSSVAGNRLREGLLKESATEVFDSVCQRYIQYLTAMRKTEESLRRLKKGKKSTLGIFSGASASKDDDRDEERIRTQMIIDVEAFGQDGKSLGTDIASVESYLQLSQMVQSELVDGECQSPWFTVQDSETQL
ncbi:oligomeric golgi complex component, COG2-domain-containing protein [Lanmaoa asiatica]|nr:oligomeric golgi complex component, COG2-domain-containing protein [Lanmaoa asiatica]